MKTKTLMIAAGLLALTCETTFAQLTYRVFATREGLVGHTTANGHVIKERDKFVALPSKTVLNANDSTYTYTVNIYYPKTGKTAKGVPVWDVGPWNTKDNYWAATREMWKDLPRGKPEAQAAYQDGYNNGKDEFGRTVLNPAGIDIADGTFWDDLGMIDNDWVEVTYNWIKGTTVDNNSSNFSASSNWTLATSAADKYGSDYRYRSTAAVSDPATWNVSLPSAGNYYAYAWWSAGSNRSSTAPYIVSHANGSTTVNVNQQLNGGRWNRLGLWAMSSGANAVKLSCWTTTGYVVIADAVNWR